MLTLLMDKPSTDHNSGCNWFRSSCWNYESEGEDSVQVVVSPANESPAARCTTKVIKTSTRSGYSSSVIKSPTGSIISPHQPNKPLTRSEAFNKGLLLQYFFCNGDHYDNSDDEHDFERKWDGHQPLTPNTWAETSSPGVSASELRYLRRRKRRGITTTTSSSTVSSITPSKKVEQTLDSENPAPTPTADAPQPAEQPKAATAAADHIQKRKNRQSLSISKSAQAEISQHVEAPPAPAPRSKPAADTPAAVTANAAGSPPTALRELPALRDAPPNKREELFKLKLQLCGVIFSFDDPTSDKRGKDMKRQTLLELVDYVNTPAGQKIFTESVMSDLMAMVSANVCRALPPATDDFDPEEDEPVLEPAWPHLQVAYEFFLRFIVSSEVNAKAAKKYVDQRFCLQLVELFDSEDPRERDYLKTILHRIYGKFMSHRSFIRRAISNVFYRFVYETERHNGIGELLEILGSIINGFAIPLKKEHLQFLVRALIPLHKPKCVGLYHQQLSYCIIQYVEKDADTATPILNGFFKCWPWSCSGKQVLFLNELEEILELLGADQLNQISKTLFTNLARCLDSDHFQVVERALFLWNNEHLVNSGCLSRLNAQTVLPIIYGPLYKNSSGHWNATVEGLAQNVLKMYMEYDLVLYDQCTTAYFKEEEDAKKKIQAIADRWHDIEEMAAANKRQRMIAAA
eukprot:scaffold6228_cov79-Cyclotella_meneghiniana.AAC.8